MRTRKDIKEEKNINFDKIEELKRRNIELSIEDMELCDDVQWYKEGKEDIVVSKKPKEVESMDIGRIYWIDTFVDEDGGCEVEVQRNKVVKVNGEWIV